MSLLDEKYGGILGAIEQQKYRDMTHGKVDNTPREKITKEDFLDYIRGGLIGMSADAIGSPVDLMTMIMRPFGYNVPSDQVVGSGDWIAKHATNPSGTTAETAGRLTTGLLTPDVMDALKLAGLLGTFAGVNAKTADQAALSKAAKMLDEGIDERQIFKETGWFKGVDNKWRFEIPDNDLNVTDYRRQGGAVVIKHDELNKAYPEYPQKIRVDSVPIEGRAYYKYPEEIDKYNYHNQGSIGIPKDKLPPNDVFGHELQHAIQRKEGFARGGSDSQFAGDINSRAIHKEWLDWDKMRNTPEFKEYQAIQNSTEYADELNRGNELWSKKYGKLYDEVDKKYRPDRSLSSKDHDEYLRQYEILKEKRREIDDMYMLEHPTPYGDRMQELSDSLGGIRRREPQKYMTSYESYLRLPGEAEARAVQKRMNYTPQQRREIFPFDDYDVPLDELIIKNNSGSSMSMSLPMDEASRMQRAKDMGFDSEKIIYSGTMGDQAKEIIPFRAYKDSEGNFMSNNRFGGIFGSFDEDVASSHGTNMQKILTRNHISHDDFVKEVNDIDNKYYENLKKLDLTESISDDELDELMDYVLGRKSVWEDEPDMGLQRLSDIIGMPEDLPEIDWTMQGIKGELARQGGYTSIGMPDEHGESVLALAGSRMQNAKFDPKMKDSANLLAGGLLGSVGLSAYLKSLEDENNAK